MTGAPAIVISAVAVVATINGIIAQMVMASRVIFGMADRKLLPPFFAVVNPATRTPLNATVVVVAIVLLLALAFPLQQLAEFTALLTLIIFALVNAALVMLKRRGTPAPAHAFIVPKAVPVAGCLLCVGLMVDACFG